MKYESEDYWEARRRAHIRARRRAAWRAVSDDVFYAVIALVALAVMAWLIYHISQQPVKERAAYLEGRFGIDHATAMAYAREEAGVSEEVGVMSEEWRTDTACASLSAGGRGHAGRVTLPSGEVAK